jgi:hypothetical protein
MSSRLIGPVAAACCAASLAQAQSPPVRYELNAGSRYLEEQCLPPCLCPWHEVRGPIEGSFTLTLVQRDPLFDHYRVSDIRWLVPVVPFPTPIEGSGRYRIGGEFALVHEMVLELTINGRTVPVESGLVGVSSRWPSITIEVGSEQLGCNRWTLNLDASPADRCYPDCDTATGVGVLDIFDFLCFQNAFALQEPYACGCDEDPPGVCDVFDFLCFQNAFEAGCP